MKLSVVTVTCRTNPRFAEMARTLLASFRRAPADTELEWLIVDDKLWREESETRLAAVREILAEQPEDVLARVHVDHFAPPPSEHRGPDISDPLPAHNTARNAGLAAVAADSSYVVFLSDCTAVTQDWIAVALDIASLNQGWRCRAFQVFDHVVPHDQPLRYQDAHDNLHGVPSTTVAGPCWGVPRDALLGVGGFDTDYDGEDDLYDHEVLMRLGRFGVAFVTTKRASVLRLNKTRTKPDITTQQSVLKAKRNQIYFQDLTRDKARILPGAAQASGPMAPPRPTAAKPTPTIRSMARASAVKAPPAPARPNPVQAPRYTPPSRPAAPPPPAPALPQAQHASEICGTLSPSNGQPCTLLAAHTGVHAHGRPAWAADPATYVDRYIAIGKILMGAPDAAEDAAAMPQAHHAELEVELDDIWYVMTDDQRDQVDPDGAPARAAGRMASLPRQAPAALSLHEQAKAADQARKERAAQERAGTAPPPASNERCIYVPGQGVYKGTQCRLRQKHGGPHSYTEAPQIKLPPPTIVPARVAAEPPPPPPGVAATIGRLDEHSTLISTHMAQLPNDAARNVVILAVIARRDGIIAGEREYLEMLAEAIPPREGVSEEDRQAMIALQLVGVRELCATLPAIPCDQTQFQAVAAYALEVDRWRIAAGLQPRVELTLYNRAYAAAGDVGLEVKTPDDFGDYAGDDLVDLERAAAAADDQVQSVEPLTPEQAAAEKAAADALFAMEADAAAAEGEAAP